MEPYTRNGGIIGKTMDFASTESYAGTSTITHVGSTTLSGSGNLALPSGLQQGDIVFVVMGDDNNNGGSAPSGWTTYIAENFTNSVYNSVWYKVMGATPDSTVTVPAVSAWVATAFRGVDTSNIFNTTFQTQTTFTNTTTPNFAPITTTTDGCMIFLYGGIDDKIGLIFTGNDGFTIGGYEDNDGGCATAFKLQSTAGTVSPATGAISTNSSDVWVTHTMALNPATVSNGSDNKKNSGIWDLQAVYEAYA